MITKVIFAGRATAEACGPFPDWALISIREPGIDNGKPVILDGWHDVLRLEFHDITESRASHVLMTPQHAMMIVEFVDRVASEVDGILVHCRAGIRRSAAVAKWIAAKYSLPFNMDYPHFNQHVFHLLEEV